jgi:hypothetical protein
MNLLSPTRISLRVRPPFAVRQETPLFYMLSTRLSLILIESEPLRRSDSMPSARVLEPAIAFRLSIAPPRTKNQFTSSAHRRQ